MTTWIFALGFIPELIGLIIAYVDLKSPREILEEEGLAPRFGLSVDGKMRKRKLTILGLFIILVGIVIQIGDVFLSS